MSAYAWQPEEIAGLEDIGQEPASRSGRTLELTAVANIPMRPIKWLWDARLGLGTFALLGGREGIGKSTFVFDLAAQITRGTLPGEYFGKPRGVIVAATEDPFEQIIRPRLTAAQADLNRVYRVRVKSADHIAESLVLPVDIPALSELVIENDVALVILDPLLSRLSATLDSHKDAEVRRALEPLVALADKTNSVVVGLIHVNKSQSVDPLTTLMGSRAFAAVARSVLYMMTDPNDENRRLLTVAKNNLGRTDLPAQSFTIESVRTGEVDGDTVWATRLRWGEDVNRTARELLQSASEGSEIRTATGEAADWMEDYLESVGGYADSAEVRREGARAGHSTSALDRARPKVHVNSSSHGFPRRSVWSLPGREPASPISPVNRRLLDDVNDVTGGTGPVASVTSVTSVPATPRAGARGDGTGPSQPPRQPRLNLTAPWPDPVDEMDLTPITHQGRRPMGQRTPSTPAPATP